MDIMEAGREAGFGLSETILCILFEERAARFLGLAEGTSVFQFSIGFDSAVRLPPEV